MNGGKPVQHRNARADIGKNTGWSMGWGRDSNERRTKGSMPATCDTGGVCRAAPHERAEVQGYAKSATVHVEPVRAFYTTGTGPENILAKRKLSYAAARSRLRTASPTEMLGTSKTGSTAQPDATPPPRVDKCFRPTCMTHPVNATLTKAHASTTAN
jgi:hypothetical protein